MTPRQAGIAWMCFLGLVIQGGAVAKPKPQPLLGTAFPAESRFASLVENVAILESSITVPEHAQIPFVLGPECSEQRNRMKRIAPTGGYAKPNLYEVGLIKTHLRNFRGRCASSFTSSRDSQDSGHAATIISGLNSDSRDIASLIEPIRGLEIDSNKYSGSFRSQYGIGRFACRFRGFSSSIASTDRFIPQFVGRNAKLISEPSYCQGSGSSESAFVFRNPVAEVSDEEKQNFERGAVFIGMMIVMLAYIAFDCWQQSKRNDEDVTDDDKRDGESG